MKKINTVFTALLFFSLNAHAAVICVLNKATGQFEVKNGGTSRAAKPDECSATALQAAMPAAAPVREEGAGPSAGVTTSAVQMGEPAAPLTPALPPKRWEVKVSDVRLAATFERWANESAADGREAYKILWDAEKHVLIDASPTYGGSLLDAVEAALSTPAIRRSAYPLEACLYPNTPPLIRITKRGEQTEACPEVK